MLKLLDELNQIKPVWIELGLQTIHPDTARFIRRGYDLSVFEQAVSRLRLLNIDVIVHTILCLPGEDMDEDGLLILAACLEGPSEPVSYTHLTLPTIA